MSKYNVLFVAELGEEWNSSWYYKAGFEKNGHNVTTFDPITVENSEEKVFQIIKEVNPDFIFHGKDELPADTFQELRGKARVIQWYPDPVIPDWLPAHVKAADIFFTMSEGLVPEFRKLNPNSFWLSQAFDPSFFEIKSITDEDKKTFASDITFAGNLGSKPQYLPRRKFLGRVLQEGFNLKWWGPRLPRKLSTIPLLIGRLGRSYGGNLVWGEAHAKISKLSKIYLGFDSKPEIRKSMSERMYIASGCGAFYMCEHVDGIEEVMEPDREIVTFKNEDEMIYKIRYYLEHDDKRRKIAEAGNARVLRDHTYKVRIREMFEIIESELKS
jgi:hypothetical protein